MNMNTNITEKTANYRKKIWNFPYGIYQLDEAAVKGILSQNARKGQICICCLC